MILRVRLRNEMTDDIHEHDDEIKTSRKGLAIRGTHGYT